MVRHAEKLSPQVTGNYDGFSAKVHWISYAMMTLCANAPLDTDGQTYYLVRCGVRYWRTYMYRRYAPFDTNGQIRHRMTDGHVTSIRPDMPFCKTGHLLRYWDKMQQEYRHNSMTLTYVAKIFRTHYHFTRALPSYFSV